MPDVTKFDNEKDWMEACVPMRIAEGDDQDQAVAVCLNMWRERKSVKSGSRHNIQDRERIRTIRRLTFELEPTDVDPEPSNDNEIEMIDIETLVAGGKSVKALGEGRIGGYLVTFGDPDQTDLEGDYFTKETDFGDADSAPVYYQHGLDSKLGKRRLGKASHKKDDFGIWAETQLQLRDEYERWIYAQAEAGRLAWSSGTAAHLVEREQIGKAYHIKSWPLGLDDSLTLTPAEPRNTVIPLKSLSVNLPPIPDNLKANAEDAGGASHSEANQSVMAISPLENMEDSEMEISEEKLTELLSAGIAQGVEQALKSLPAPHPPAVTVVTDEADQPFASPSEFFKAVKMAALYPAQEDVRLRPLKATGMSEGVPADGGYLLQPQMASTILERLYDTDSILSRVSMDTVTGNSMLYNGVDESSHATSLYGGIVGYWLGEGATKIASKPAFYQLSLKLKKIAALCYATDEQLEDVANLETWLTRTIPNVLRWYVEEAIINGDGSGKPTGIMNSPSLVTVTRDTGSYIKLADIANMWSRRWRGVNDYVWLIEGGASAQLHQLTAATAPIYMPAGNVAGSPFGTLYGRPVIETEHCQALNTAGDIILASLSQYQMISKGGVQSAKSIHVAFLTDETAFRFVYRVDGAPLWNSALTPAHGSSTVSPFVCLSSAT